MARIIPETFQEVLLLDNWGAFVAQGMVARRDQPFDIIKNDGRLFKFCPRTTGDNKGEEDDVLYYVEATVANLNLKF